MVRSNKELCAVIIPQKSNGSLGRTAATPARSSLANFCHDRRDALVLWALSRLVKRLFVATPQVSDPQGAIRRVDPGHNHAFAADDSVSKLFAMRPDEHRQRRRCRLQ